MPYVKRSCGDSEIEEWTNENGDLHRLDGPAFVDREMLTKEVLFEAYWIHGQRHRNQEEGPALRFLTLDKTEFHEIYFWEGCRHRDRGPAVIVYDYQTKAVKRTEYWFEGEQRDVDFFS